jgi:hypothetical protein
VELKIVTLATEVQAKLALTAQLATNQTADHHAATCAVSRMLSLSSPPSAGSELSRSVSEAVMERSMGMECTLGEAEYLVRDVEPRKLWES